MRGALIFLFVATVVIVAIIEGAAYVALHPQDFPWTRLDLDDPVGGATGRKLTSLTDEPRRCRVLLTEAGDADVPVPRRLAEPPCGYADGMRLTPEDNEAIRFSPAAPVTSCPVAAALALWERDVVQPAAMRRFGQRVATIGHAGSYSCRRLYGRAEGRYSEHATADAFDILDFRLADGRRISVLRNWSGSGTDAAFLHEVRDGACRLFATVLSPDYNLAHADHLHVDQAERGAMGWRLCD